MPASPGAIEASGRAHGGVRHGDGVRVPRVEPAPAMTSANETAYLVSLTGGRQRAPEPPGALQQLGRALAPSRIRSSPQ